MSVSLPPIAILAGGLGTRLKNFTQNTPKAMVEVAGSPFIFHQLNRLRQEGITQVVLCVGHLASPLQDYIGDGQKFGMQVAYSLDGNELLGTGGAIAKSLPLLSEDLFFVTYGDTYLDIDYKSVYDSLLAQPALAGMMTVLFNENQWGESNCLYEDGLVKVHNKKAPTPDMKYIDYGLSLLKKVEFQTWIAQGNRKKFELNEYFSFLAEQKKMGAYVAKNRFHEIGTPESLKETSEFLMKGYKDARI